MAICKLIAALDDAFELAQHCFIDSSSDTLKQWTSFLDSLSEHIIAISFFDGSKCSVTPDLLLAVVKFDCFDEGAAMYFKSRP